MTIYSEVLKRIQDDGGSEFLDLILKCCELDMSQRYKLSCFLLISFLLNLKPEDRMAQLADFCGLVCHNLTITENIVKEDPPVNKVCDICNNPVTVLSSEADEVIVCPTCLLNQE